MTKDLRSLRRAQDDYWVRRLLQLAVIVLVILLAAWVIMQL